LIFDQPRFIYFFLRIAPQKQFELLIKGDRKIFTEISSSVLINVRIAGG